MSKVKKFEVGGESIDVGVDWSNVDNKPTIPSAASDISTDEGISDGKTVQSDLSDLALKMTSAEEKIGDGVKTTIESTRYDNGYIANDTAIGAKKGVLTPYTMSGFYAWVLFVKAGDVATIKTKHKNASGGSSRSYTIYKTTDDDKYECVKQGWVNNVEQDLITNPAVETIEYDGVIIMNLKSDYNSYLSQCSLTAERGDLSTNVKDVDSRVTTVENMLSNDILKNRQYVNSDGTINQLNCGASLVSLIHSWGFCGGSTSSGEIAYKEDGTNKYIDMYDYSIGQRLCALNGVAGYNFSYGGQYAKGWCNGTTARTWNGAQQSDNLKQAYIIDFGANDVTSALSEYSGGLGSIDTDIDWDDYSNNADTFVGWYIGLIQRLRSVASGAYIFILTSRRYMYDSSSTYVTTALPLIKSMVDVLKTHYERIYLIDNNQYGIQYGTSLQSVLMNGNHPSAIGYQLEAFVLNTLIDNCIRNNMADFKESCFALTGQHYS